MRCSLVGVKFVAQNGSRFVLRSPGTEPILFIDAEINSSATDRHFLRLGVDIGTRD